MAENTATLEASQARTTSGTATDALGGQSLSSGISPELAALRRSPAGHLRQVMEEAEVTGERSVALREIAFAPQVGIRVTPGTASARAVEEALGVPLPAGHGSTTGDAQGSHVLWLGPDEFLAVDASRQQVPGEAGQIAARLDGLPGQVLDLSANRTILELSGASAREVLEKGCHIDLHPRAFGVSTAVSTQLGPVPVIIHRAAQQTWRILPRASFAHYTVTWLVDAMQEYGSEDVR